MPLTSPIDRFGFSAFCCRLRFLRHRFYETNFSRPLPAFRLDVPDRL